MYTQCSECGTVFKLSADVLRAAGGQVRCGKCGEVFNALARLAEAPSAFETGESPLDLEARANSILETAAAPRVAQQVAKDEEEFAPAGVEIAQLEVLDWSDQDQAERRDAEAQEETSLEFTLPPGELDRIFVETKLRAPQAAPEDAEPPPDAQAEGAAAGAARTQVSGLEVPEDVRRQMLAGFEPVAESDPQLESEIELLSGSAGSLVPAPRPAAFMAWLIAALAAALLLIAQIMHQNREWVVAHAHGPFGAGVRALYGALGTPLPAPASLSAYQLRQWGVTGDPEANGKLRLRASILNTAPQLQPFPLLRVTLADRFGKSIGTRDFEPSEYLGKPTARLLAPGERADAVLEILDPGKNAEGFEIDVCLRGADQRISCANDAAAQAKR